MELSKKVEILSSSGSKRYDNNIIKTLTGYRLPEPPAILKKKEIKYTFDMNKNTRYIYSCQMVNSKMSS